VQVENLYIAGFQVLNLFVDNGCAPAALQNGGQAPQNKNVIIVSGFDLADVFGQVAHSRSWVDHNHKQGRHHKCNNVKLLFCGAANETTFFQHF
jgi:hypothetical protein